MKTLTPIPTHVVIQSDQPHQGAHDDRSMKGISEVSMLSENFQADFFSGHQLYSGNLLRIRILNESGTLYLLS